MFLTVFDGTFHSSVAVDGGGTSPPNANAAVDVPNPAKLSLEVFKLFTSTQLAPLYSSVLVVCGGPLPPKAKADVLSPAPPNEFLAVFIFPESAQFVPFQVSEADFDSVSYPPKS